MYHLLVTIQGLNSKEHTSHVIKFDTLGAATKAETLLARASGKDGVHYVVVRLF